MKIIDTKSRQQFLMALMFFTRLPLGRHSQYDPALNAGIPKYLPAIGWLIGGLFSLAGCLLSLLLPTPVALTLSLALCVLATGALHEDGFADVCDGLGGCWNKEQSLRIMKDSHLGSYGVLGLILLFATLFSALLTLTPLQACAVVTAAHVLSRFTTFSLILTLPYARSDDSAKTPPLSIQRNDLWLALALTSPALLLLPFTTWAYSIFALWLLRYGFAELLKRKLGGYTGDCLGALQQLSFVLLIVIGSSY